MKEQQIEELERIIEDAQRKIQEIKSNEEKYSIGDRIKLNGGSEVFMISVHGIWTLALNSIKTGHMAGKLTDVKNPHNITPREMEHLTLGLKYEKI